MNLRQLVLIAMPIFFSLNVQAIDIKSQLRDLNQKPLACGVLGGILGTTSYFAYKACQKKFNISEKIAPMMEKTKARLAALNKKPLLCGIIGGVLGTSAALTYRYFIPLKAEYKVIEL